MLKLNELEHALQGLRAVVIQANAKRSIESAKAKLCGGNVKLGNMASFSKLYGDHYTESTAFGVAVRGTCSGYCSGCKNACYVSKSYRYGSVITRHTENTLAFRIDIGKAFADIDSQLTRKRKPWKIVRINQSGEIESAKEFMLWCKVARNHAETIFYIYSKAFDLILDTVKAGKMPDNMYLLVSVWHEYGISEYKSVSHIKNVKAFVYDDGAFNYAAAGLDIQTYCKAYDDRGRLDHNITCDKCRKCFNNSKACKIIGCKAH